MNRDGTGPDGQGANTGRGYGPCDTNGNIEYSKEPNRVRTPKNPKGDGTNSQNGSGRPQNGRGLGQGRGRGLGRRK